ncbi:MAG: beta-exotoxin transport system ATP-binding protein [Patescibacteria group bacterium]|nr:beta-exotoxin transport system ATP-binding protein [Patescibacteria group bacterium]
MPVAAIQFKHTTKHYGPDRGVFDLNFSVPRGQIFGFLGPNGAGKTTTIRMMLDAIRPSNGSITLLGLDSRRDSLALHRRIGYLSGDMEMDRRLTGRQYLEYVANLRGNVPWAKIEKLIDRLDCQTDKKIAYLSRGNKQKIGLVAALMHSPDLLILDEPTSGLDPLIQDEFQKLMREHKAAGKTAFISSHVLSEVQEVCDHVGFIREGKLVDVQPLNSLQRKSLRKVRLTLSRPNSKALKGLKGVHDLQIHGKEVSCNVTENFNGLLQALAKLQVKDIVIEEASLEDMFRHYYQESDNA